MHSRWTTRSHAPVLCEIHEMFSRRVSMTFVHLFGLRRVPVQGSDRVCFALCLCATGSPDWGVYTVQGTKNEMSTLRDPQHVPKDEHKAASVWFHDRYMLRSLGPTRCPGSGYEHHLATVSKRTVLLQTGYMSSNGSSSSLVALITSHDSAPRATSRCDMMCWRTARVRSSSKRRASARCFSKYARPFGPPTNPASAICEGGGVGDDQRGVDRLEGLRLNPARQ